jgi:hypothetical protein
MEVKADLRMMPRISAGRRKEKSFCPCLILDSNTDAVVGFDGKVEEVDFSYRGGNNIGLPLKSCSSASMLFLPLKVPMHSDRHGILFVPFTGTAFASREFGPFGGLRVCRPDCFVFFRPENQTFIIVSVLAVVKGV